MLFYTMFITIVLLFTTGINFVYVSKNNLYVWDMLFNILYAILICAIIMSAIAILVRIMPKKYFNPNRKRYKCPKFEEKIYKKLKIHKWKGIVPDGGRTGGFKKKNLVDPRNEKYMQKYLFENCLAETVHVLSIMLSFLILILIPHRYLLTIALPIFLTFVFLNLLPILVVRSIRPKLLKVYNHLLVQAEEEKQEDDDTELVNV